MPKVYIINRAPHDYSDAERFGEPVFLSEGKMNRFATNSIYRQFYEFLRESSPEDYILITSLNTMNIVACCIMTELHHQINILIHNSKEGIYVSRSITFKQKDNKEAI